MNEPKPITVEDLEFFAKKYPLVCLKAIASNRDSLEDLKLFYNANPEVFQ